MKRKIAVQLGAVMLMAGGASAQEAAGTAAPTPQQQGAATGGQATGSQALPEIEVIQETPTQKAARAKKAVPVSPLAKASSAPAPAPATTAASTAPTAAPTGAANPAALKVPSAVTTVSEGDIARQGTGQVQQALQQQVPGIVISDTAGNPLRAEVSYRGFDASPVSGRAQGIAVYQNGVRINEAFGDVVNWDVIPSNAIASVSVVSNNPSFGLNALGGAISLTTKDGFSYQGAEIDFLAGSFGHYQVGVQAGASSGNAAAYVAVEGIQDGGFRDFSESEIRRFYGDIGLKGSLAEVHFSLTAASNDFGATAAAPIELLERDRSNTFTSPQTTDLEVLMPTLSGTVKATNTLTLAGVGYYRSFKNRVVDGNVTDIEACDPAGPFSGFLCLDEEDADPGDDPRITSSGVPVGGGAVLGPLGSIERLSTDSWSWGGTVEGEEKTPLFGRPNQLVVGVSYDRGRSKYRTSSELGTIEENYVVEGSGLIVRDGENEIAPRNIVSENTYVGLYFSNALDVTDRFTLTFGGRYNHATIELQDLTGDFDGLNATNKYDRFNPQVGGTYKILPGLSLYGGYSESNRAPTPAELGCAEEEFPCLIESFLTDDPPLEQVVGRTAEVGLRGQGFNGTDRLTWSAGLFRTLASNDILPIPVDGRFFFENAGDTLRQGIELAATYEASRWSVYGSYAFVDATLDACTQPDVDGECAFLEQGDRLPGIPRHRFKAGVEYWLTPKWKFGADLVAASNQPFFRNEAAREDGDRSDDLPGYVRVDLNTSYDLTKNIQVYGLVKNLFNSEYGLYGTYFEADDVSDVDVGLGGPGFEDPRTISPALPFAAYGGVKVKF